VSGASLERSSYHVARMDCAAEESLVRMKLEGLPSVRSLRVDLDARRVDVVHEGGSDAIGRALRELSLGSSLVASRPAEDGEAGPGDDTAATQARVLWTVLAINGGFFMLEAASGLLARSLGLLGDSLDMLADAFVYALALVVTRGSAALKGRIARLSGVLQMALAVLGFAEVVRRAVTPAAPPGDVTMMVVAALALAGNAATLALLRRARSGEAHMRASVIFTSNDVIINLGVIAAGALVALTGSRWPDLAIGTAVFAVVARGAVRILALSR